MNENLIEAQKLIDFIYESPTVFHAVENIKEILIENSFLELKEEDRWKIDKGGRYFVIRNQSALVAFIAGSGKLEDDGFKIIGAHTDSPGFRIKPIPEIETEGSYIKLNTEVYGGPIINTWLDRPLSVAGRVVLKTNDFMNPETRLINIKRPLLVIPNLAIHMNRNVNSGIELNKQKDILPILALVNKEMESKNCLIKAIAEEINVEVNDIADFDLFLYEFQKGCITGLNNEFISSGRLDDLSMVYAGISALASSSESKSTKVMVCFDNEEVGNTTKQGANSDMLGSLLERISICLGLNKEDYFRAQAKSFIISCDLGHALHPNYPEKSDPVNRPVINKGPVIKISASQSYTSDGISSAVYEGVCRKVGIPVQRFVNRSDERGGSTIGPTASSKLNMRSVDIGIAVLAMHSIREFGGTLDYIYSLDSFVEYYNS
ncbi:MAG: M18 family aminopeptidase [Solirubrobacterales bacterium]